MKMVIAANVVGEKDPLLSSVLVNLAGSTGITISNSEEGMLLLTGPIGVDDAFIATKAMEPLGRRITTFTMLKYE